MISSGSESVSSATRRRSLREWVAKALFATAAVPIVLRAAVRVGYWNRQPLEQAVAALRRVGPLRLSFLARPVWLLGTVDRLLPLLPPRRMGPCLKRSLYLADLWSRCSLSPRVHLSVRSSGEGAAEGHAWITTGGGPSTSSQGYPEAFVL